ncbi:DUF898 family protein [Phenylobacterium sp.]|uniref:DUF898 family protein n=1 Tax=Phenylobacterium sp. TaxID=1871053 RepID=UPI0035AE6E23
MSRTDGVAGGTSLALEQQIDTAAFLGLSLRCALLTVATLGLYGFWGRSEARRWLWDATALGGEPLEYGGTGGELLAGFVIKWLAVGGCLLGAWASFRAMGPWGAPLIALLTGAAVYAYGFTRFAGFVYLASRTAWRGEMFEVEGSPVAFAARELRDAALMVLTAGWWAPRVARARGQALWGGLRHPKAWPGYDAAAAARQPLYSAFAIGWFASVMVVLFVGGVMLGLASGFFPTPQPGAAPSVGQLAALALLLAGLWLLLRAAWAPYGQAVRAASAAGFGLRLAWGGKGAARAALADGAALVGSLGFLKPWVRARERVRLLRALAPPLSPGAWRG